MDVIDLAAMIRAAAAQLPDSPYSCAECIVAALPSSATRREIAAWLASPVARRRALLSLPAAARLMARRAGVRRCEPSGGGPAWGLVDARPDGRAAFAVRVAARWWAYSGNRGVAKVHASRVLIAWEID